MSYRCEFLLPWWHLEHCLMRPPNMKLLIPYQLVQCGSRTRDAYIS